MFKRLLIRVALAAAVVVPLSVTVVAHAATTSDGGGWTPPPNPVWTACPNATDGQVCTIMQVPVNWQDPDGPTIPLTVGKAPAKGPDRIGALGIFTSTGGIRTYVTGTAFPGIQALRSRFDIVSIDWRTRQIVCSTDVLTTNDNLVFPDDQATWDQTLADNTARGKSCREHTGALVDNVDARNMAYDWDAVRRLLGEPKITLYSEALSTIIAKEYAKLFPSHLRALAEGSIWDHAITNTTKFFTDWTVAQEKAFNAFVDWAERDPNSPLFERDAAGIWEQLYTAAQQHRLINPSDGSEVTLQRLHLVTVNDLAYPVFGNGWKILADDWDTLYGWITPTPATAGPAAAQPADDTTALLGDYTAQGQLCSNYHFPVSGPDELHQDAILMAKLAPHTKIVGVQVWPEVTGCQDWPAATKFPQQRTPVTGPAPILAVVGLGDSWAPYQEALSAVSEFANATIVKYLGFGWISYWSVTCVQQYVQNFLFTGQSPGKGAVCPAVFPDDPAAATAAAAAPQSLASGASIAASSVGGPISVTKH